MEWINSNDIKAWANERSCQDTLPLLVRKLIMASSNKIEFINFPSRNDVSTEGFDGVLYSKEKSPFFPKGNSIWEMGVNKDVKTKADKDYKKRKEDKTIKYKKRITYIHVTPRVWQKSDIWVNEKKKEGIWKDVRVITVEQLTQWINDNPSVGSWLAKEIGKFTSGVQSLEGFWDEWSQSSEYILPPKLLISCRENEKATLLSKCGSPNLIFIEGVSKIELTAFIVACFLSSTEHKEELLSRSIIVDNEEGFRSIVSQKTPLIIIPKFENPEILYNAIRNGHTVIVPIVENKNQPNTFRLPKISKVSMRENLLDMGLSESLAKKYAQESLGNITVLRRLLKFPQENPEWSKEDNYTDILPALLVGQWCNNYEGDKGIISKMSGLSYDEYIRKLSKWLDKPDSPIIRIGNIWRIHSFFDSWIFLSKYIIDSDFDNLENVFIDSLSEIDPSLDQEDVNGILFYKAGKYSKNIKEGITQSLLFISCFKNNFEIKKSNPHLWVDGVIAKLLNNKDVRFWKSLDRLLPLIAEASPDSFLYHVESFFEIENSPIKSLFIEKKGYLSNTSYHTGLLWALECIAWDPQYLARVSVLLIKLAEYDPGGSLTNRPINSFLEIYKPWHYQTYTSFENRIEILQTLKKYDLKTVKKLLIGLLPRSFGETAQGTYKPRWRYYYDDAEINYNYIELFNTYSEIVKILLSIFDNSEEMLTELLELSSNKGLTCRKLIIDFVSNNINNITQINYSAWHELRGILYHHRLCPDAKWALSANDLMVYEEFYNKLMPIDERILNVWKFSNRPEFIEGYKYERGEYEKRDKYIFDERLAALKALYKNNGLSVILELVELVECPHILGNVSGCIVDDEKKILEICALLKEGDKKLSFSQNFIRRLKLNKGYQYIFDLYNKLSEDSMKVIFLLSLNQERELLDFIEKQESNIISGYWMQVIPHCFFYDSIDDLEFYIKKLIDCERFISALNICYHNIENMPSDKIVLILEKLITTEPEKSGYLDNNELDKVFDHMEQRYDIEDEIKIKLQWYYIDILCGSLNSKQRFIHKMMSREPYFFIYIIKMLYKTEDCIDDKNIEDAERKRDLAKKAFTLLRTWKTIPGLNEENEIDDVKINYWINLVREEGGKSGILGVIDSYIGHILANCEREKDVQWPPIIICEIIEKIRTVEIKNGFSTELYNIFGMTTRSPFDGGLIENKRSEYYKSIADSCSNIYPFVASIFYEISKLYLDMASKEDFEAELNRIQYQ